MASLNCINGTPPPFHIPGYQGYVPSLKTEIIGKTFTKGTHAALRVLGLGGVRDKPCMKSCGSGDPCLDHWRDLRAKLHKVQGTIDPNPCEGTEWNTRNKFCIDKPQNPCERKLVSNNQHGYLSRLSVYRKKPGEKFGVGACKASNDYPCKGSGAADPPFWQEYEDMTNYDPFKEYPPECRHLRLPKLKYKELDDKNLCIPCEYYEDYLRERFSCEPRKCECLPLDAKKHDNDIKWYGKEADPDSFVSPIFADPTNKYRYFKTGYLGHVPTYNYRVGESYENSTRKALNMFTNRYMTTRLKALCPVWIDPQQYCDDNDYFKLCCKPRRSYDGHFDEKRIRDRLKPQFHPRDCLPPDAPEPLPLRHLQQQNKQMDICDYNNVERQYYN